MEVLVEQNIDGSTGYYLYDPNGNVTGITNEIGQVYQSYRYDAFGQITFGAPQYENEYTYNGESYNPNIQSQYLRARYYNVISAVFITEDTYLGDINEPLTLNRYNYCISNPVNFDDPSGNKAIVDRLKKIRSTASSLWNSFLNETSKYIELTAENLRQTSNIESMKPVVNMQKTVSSDEINTVVDDIFFMMETYDNLVSHAIMAEYANNKENVRLAIEKAYLAAKDTQTCCYELEPSNKIIQFMITEEGKKNTKYINGELWHFQYDTHAKAVPDWTIGYGTKIENGEYPNGISDKDAQNLFEKYIHYSVTKLNDFLNVGGELAYLDKNENVDSVEKLQLSQQQFDALISLSYNAGKNIFLSKDEYAETQYIIKNMGLQKSDGTELFGAEYWAGEKAEKEILNNFACELLFESYRRSILLYTNEQGKCFFRILDSVAENACFILERNDILENINSGDMTYFEKLAEKLIEECRLHVRYNKLDKIVPMIGEYEDIFDGEDAVLYKEANMIKLDINGEKMALTDIVETMGLSTNFTFVWETECLKDEKALLYTFSNEKYDVQIMERSDGEQYIRIYFADNGEYIVYQCTAEAFLN